VCVGDFFNEVRPDLFFILSKINFKNLFYKFFLLAFYLLCFPFLLAMDRTVFGGMMLNNKQIIASFCHISKKIYIILHLECFCDAILKE